MSFFKREYINIESLTLHFSEEGIRIKLKFYPILTQDIYGIINKYIKSIKDTKSLMIASKDFNKFMSQDFIDYDSNNLWALIRVFPDKPWNWKKILSNPNTTWEIIKRLPLSRIDWHFVSKQNPSVTWEIIKSNPECPWDWIELTTNPSISMEIIQGSRVKGWDIYNTRILENPNITFEFYERLKHPKWGNMFMFMLSKSAKTTWKIISDNPDVNWNWEGISLNPNITWDIIKNNLEKPWDWYNISLNSNITWDIIKKNPDYNWDPRAVTINPNITRNP